MTLAYENAAEGGWFYPVEEAPAECATEGTGGNPGGTMVANGSHLL